MIEKGCHTFLASVIDVAQETPLKVGDIRIIKEFPNIFPVDLPGLPPTREIDFTIELESGTKLISKALYRWHLPNSRS